MPNNKVGINTFNYFNSGYNCSESIYMALVEHFKPEEKPIPPNPASAFCGGIGKSHCETCGALTGGVLALGTLYGRTLPKDNFDKAWQVAAEFRTRFVELYQATQCRAILDIFGEQKDLMACKQMTGKATELLVELIQEWDDRVDLKVG